MPAISYKKARRMIKSSIAASARWDIEAEEDGEIEDECTVQLCQHGSIYRYKDRPDKIKLIGKYKHEAYVHVIGGISRKV